MPQKAGRRPQGDGTIRKRPDGRWEARVTIGRDPGTGKQVQKSIYGKTQKEVRQKLQQIAVAIDNKTYMEPSRITLKEWLEIWLSTYIGNVKPLTRSAYQTQINNHIVPALGAVKLSAITAPSIQKLYNELQGDKGLSAKTIKNIHGVLHKALQKAVEVNFIPVNPSDACTLPRVNKVEINPLSEVEISAFLRAIEGHRFQKLYIIDLFTGMRQSEILGLQWECVDFDRGTILVNKQLQKEKYPVGKYVLTSLKNDKPRVITPAETVMQMLREHKKHQLEQRLAAGSLWDNGDFGNLVFTNDFGNHLCHVTVLKNFKKLVAQADIPEARFHDLRHTFAVISLQEGDDVKTVQENLGHHTAAFTLDVYGHVSERMKKESAQRMEGFIQGIQSRK